MRRDLYSLPEENMIFLMYKMENLIDAQYDGFNTGDQLIRAFRSRESTKEL